MAGSRSIHSASVTLDQLIALNDEIVALVRSGVPLEQGLGHLGTDLPGRLGRLATSLAERMERGESLAHALGDEAVGVPPVYRAVVEAGLRSGRLTAALEAVARSSRQLAELRRMVTAAFVYPLLLFFLAWGLFVLFTVKIAPALLSAFRDFEAAHAGPLAVLVGAGESVHVWGAAVPLGVLILACLWWALSSRAAVVEPRFAQALLGWLPWTGRLLGSLRSATVAEVLAMLVEHDVPLGEGVTLAAQTVGDRQTKRAAAEISAAFERGQPIPPASGGGAFSPFLNWLMAAAPARGTLLSALRHAAEMYRRQAARQADVAHLFLPVALTLVIGGTVTILYALMLFLPWISLMHDLARY